MFCCLLLFYVMLWYVLLCVVVLCYVVVRSVLKIDHPSIIPFYIHPNLHIIMWHVPSTTSHERIHTVPFPVEVLSTFSGLASRSWADLLIPAALCITSWNFSKRNAASSATVFSLKSQKSYCIWYPSEVRLIATGPVNRT